MEMSDKFCFVERSSQYCVEQVEAVLPRLLPWERLERCENHCRDKENLNGSFMDDHGDSQINVRGECASCGQRRGPGVRCSENEEELIIFCKQKVDVLYQGQDIRLVRKRRCLPSSSGAVASTPADSVFRVKLMSDLGGYRPREESQVPAGLGSDDCSLCELCGLRKCVLKESTADGERECPWRKTAVHVDMKSFLDNVCSSESWEVVMHTESPKMTQVHASHKGQQ
ncbi:hypothetical protein E5288_WYG011528 [Bos mutus]|uniref:Uncharacterized protein n=1 Tax=Bos mutus TaxID=72004 RepID=A0A6B0RI42_9CETA|nr:hypothetical protein [Bos mutus]